MLLTLHVFVVPADKHNIAHLVFGLNVSACVKKALNEGTHAIDRGAYERCGAILRRESRGILVVLTHEMKILREHKSSENRSGRIKRSLHPVEVMSTACQHLTYARFTLSLISKLAPA